jgi:thymidylate synthase ThyX
MELLYPRFIHSEFMTYRAFSRNAASSRAIPASKYREAVEVEPALPVWWGKNQAGMKAREELPEEIRAIVKGCWLDARDLMLQIHGFMGELGLHKQVLNRILEPWAHITVIATANREAYEHLFFERCHEDAQPEFQALAFAMRESLLASTPQFLENGEWHLPYLQPDELASLDADAQRKISAARCARVSYLTHDGKRDHIEDLNLFDKLVPGIGENRPGHWSPLEHVAESQSDSEPWGNFKGFRQYRKFFSFEFGRME